MIKAIIHDWDDVVTNSFEAYAEFYFDFAKYFSLDPPPTLEGLRRHWGKTIPQIAKGQWPQLATDKVEQMVLEFFKYKKAESLLIYPVKIFPGVVGTFEKLGEKFKLAILTSGSKPRVEEIYRQMIHPQMVYHEIIVGPPGMKFCKPDPRVFDPIFEHFKRQGIGERETIYVGDNLIDLVTAKNRSLEFYAVTTGVNSKEDFEAAGLKPDHILVKFSDIVLISNLI